ncbi:nuclear transport factor 2 family protein [Williamsia muralis]|uniref:SnoaL-like domain-containing protein n=1 Tax=Williamsia marianensis TaxID=85044 RepID=A0A2G3PK12_WILMA|nr:nuclear transport factor 2 family protein [Williamsia marianensis]PHV66145.1 hypothetical protein CSW57_21240 [Williamsia marianensis]
MQEDIARHLLDRLEIQDLQARYAIGQDEHQGSDGDVAEQWREVFAADAELDYSSGGYPGVRATYPELIEWMRGTAGEGGVMNVFDNWQHMLGLPTVAIDGDEATARTDLLATHKGKPGPRGESWNLMDACTFYDTLRRIDGKWLITHRRLEVHWLETFAGVAPLAGEF